MRIIGLPISLKGSHKNWEVPAYLKAVMIRWIDFEKAYRYYLQHAKLPFPGNRTQMAEILGGE